MPLTKDEANKLMADIRAAVAPFVEQQPAPPAPRASTPPLVPGKGDGPLSEAEMRKVSR